MKPPSIHERIVGILAIAAGTLCLPVQTAIAQTYFGNGYTIVEGIDGNTLPDDLDARVFKSITAYTVEEGLHQLLEGSGWSLAGHGSADPDIYRLYGQRYADNKRTISPMPLSSALQWIAGDGWELVVDRVNRLVSFEVRGRYAHMPIIPKSLTNASSASGTGSAAYAAGVTPSVTSSSVPYAAPLANAGYYPDVPDTAVSDKDNIRASQRMVEALERQHNAATVPTVLPEKPLQQRRLGTSASADGTAGKSLRQRRLDSPLTGQVKPSSAIPASGTTQADVPTVTAAPVKALSAEVSAATYDFANFIENTQRTASGKGKSTRKRTSGKGGTR